MPDLPKGMLQEDRHVVPHFEMEEYLYRRVPNVCWDDEDESHPIDLDAIELPDMSVGRSKYAHPEWLRLASGCDDWGVVGFQVQDVPSERFVDGVQYDFRAEHAPERRNYPHSEVRAYEHVDNRHVDGKSVLLPERVHLEWRERLLRKIRVFLRAYQPAEIRQHAPVSHVPEPQ